MTTTCKKCGAPASEDQAFCAKCGAVIGMDAPKRSETPPNLARTIVAGDYKLPPLPKKQPAQRSARKGRGDDEGDSRKSRASLASARPDRRTAEKGSRNSALLVVVGFLAVLVFGGLLFLLLYFFLHG